MSIKSRPKQNVPTKKKPTKKEKYICTSCGKEKLETEYYSTASYFFKNTGKVPFCKECTLNYLEDTNEYSLRSVLRVMDKPFLSDLFYNTSIPEAQKNNRELFGVYMKNLAMFHFKDLTYSNSDEMKERKRKARAAHEEWGDGLSKNDVEFLDNFYGEYINTYSSESPVQRAIYKNIAQTHLQARKALEKGDQKTYKDLMAISSKLHNDAFINPVQMTGANEDKGLSTFGLWIQNIEREEPCEYFEDKPIYEDYDSFRKYIEKWFIRPMKNLFGLTRDFDVEVEEKEDHELVVKDEDEDDLGSER